MTKKRRVLVLTERFPPDVCGGAELSLADTLRAIDPTRFSLKVIALASSPLQNEPEGPIEVTRLGRETEWPPGRRAIHEKYAGADGWADRIARSLRINLNSLSYVLSHRRAWRALAQLASIDRQSEAVIGDNNFAGGGDDAMPASVQAIIDDFRPELIHADNLLATMVSARCDPRGARRVSLVRDNRFFCAHARQQMLVDDVACSNCDQLCVKDRSHAFAALFRKELRAVRADRIAALRRSDAILTTSQFLKDQIEAIAGPGNISAIGNPIPSDIAFQTGDRDSDGSNVLFIGALERRKGAHLVADVMGEVLMAVPEAKFIFAGEGSLSGAIEEQAATAGVSDRVSVSGFLRRDEVQRLLSASALVVTPTLWPEPFGRVPLEASSAGRPVIASDIGGHRETIVDGKTGRLVPPGRRSDLRDAIIALLLDPAMARQMGQAGRRHTASQFALGEVAGRLQDHWAACCAGSEDRGRP